MTKEQIMQANLDELSIDKLKKALKTMEESKEKHLESLQDAIDDLDEDDKMSLFREYAEDGRYEGRYYNMSDLDEVVGPISSTSEFLRKLGDFSLKDEGFWYSPSTGDLESGSKGDFLENFFFASDIANWLERRDFETDVPFDWKDELEEIDDCIYDIECAIEDKEE